MSFSKNIQYRTMSIESVPDSDECTAYAALSSEAVIERFWGKEILSHDANAINLDRAKDGLPLLWNHDNDKPIGIVIDIKLDDDGKLRGLLRFSNNAKAQEVWRDIKDGFLKNISIGYRILDWEENKDVVTVTKWELFEASITPVPADSSVGIGRSFDTKTAEESLMNKTAEGYAETQQQQAADDMYRNRGNSIHVADDVHKIRKDYEHIAVGAHKKGRIAERRRMEAINECFRRDIIPQGDSPFAYEFEALRIRAIEEDWSVETTNNVILDALSQNAARPIGGTVGVTDTVRGMPHPDKPVQKRDINAVVVDDELDKFKAGVELALEARTGLLNTKTDQNKQALRKAKEGGFLGVRLSRLAEQYLRLRGEDVRSFSDEAIARRALAYRGHGATTSDFAALLSNTANKTLLRGWEETAETWQQWARIGTVPDFKMAERVGISGFGALDKIPEDGEIKYGKFVDRKEIIQAFSYAKKFRLTYQAIKNDDLGAFTTIPRAMGRAAQAIIGDVVYGLLKGVGPTLRQDDTALFNTAKHGNYVEAANAPPSVVTLDAAFNAMAQQTDGNSDRPLNITPKYLLVPKALDTTSRTLMASQYDPAAIAGAGSKNVLTPNPFQSRLEVISDARLDKHPNGGTAWYLIADSMLFDTVEVAFVDGIAEPYLREEEEWDTRGVEWVVGVDFGVAALDYRGLYKHKGAA